MSIGKIQIPDLVAWPMVSSGRVPSGPGFDRSCWACHWAGDNQCQRPTATVCWDDVTDHIWLARDQIHPGRSGTGV